MRRSALRICLAAGVALAATSCASRSPHYLDPYTAVVRILSLDRDDVLRDLEPVPYNDGERQQRLQTLFREAGCDGPRLQEQRIKGSGLPNVICRLPGETPDTIVVGAHFDRPRYGKGIVDNWGSIAMLPILYRTLDVEPRRHSFEFIGFTDAARRQVGSFQYLKSLPDERRQRIRGMVNLKAVGMDRTSVWAQRADPNLWVDLFSVSESMKIPLRVVNFGCLAQRGRPNQDWRSCSGFVHADSESFRRFGIPTITIHSFDKDSARMLRDAYLDKDVKLIRVDDYYDTYRLVATYLGYLDDTLEVRRRALAGSDASG